MKRAAAYVGRPVERLEDLRLLAGRGQYVDDLAPAGLLHAAILRSSVAHGRIRSMDTRAARAVPGVYAVITAADLGEHVPRIPLRMEGNAALSRFVQPVLAQVKVRYVGEPLALVVASTAAIAEDAVGEIQVDIDALPAVTEHTVSASGEVLLFEEHETNHAMALTGARGDVDAAIASADYVRRERFRIQRVAAMPMETRGLLAEWDAQRERMKLSGAMKVPFSTRALLARLLELPEEAVEVVECDVGGGFGVRGEFYPEDFLIPYASRLLNRPVKWIEDRREHLLATNHARGVECELEIACRRDGTIVGLRGEAWSDSGAYIRPNAVTAPRNIAQMVAGPYRIANMRMKVSMLLTNKTPVASYRGPGRFETDFCRERLIDLAAQDLGIDRVELRRRNLLTDADMPYPLPTVLPYGSSGETDSGDYRVTFDRCLEEFGWAEKARLAGKLVNGVYHGLGIGCYIEGGATGPRENARLLFEPDGSIAVYVGSSAIGQGLETICAQIAADALGVPMERISGVYHGSTGVVREGLGSWGSRATVMGGSAIIDAAANLKKAIVEKAAEQFGCTPAEVALSEDMRTVSAGARTRTLTELCPEGVAAEGTFNNSKRTYSYGTHAAHVTVDPETGDLRVLEYVAVEDVGRIINPMTLHNQTLGAIVQGLGSSILENVVYDDEGQLLSGSLASYLMPSAEDFPNVKTIALELFPSPTNPLGAKGAGEGGIIPVGGVIANAVASALATLTVQPFELPLTPPRIWSLVRHARATAEKQAGA
ncbi:MAG TPA: xanthine dehydrogenase family protein molybdopterin-binding subunit [Burkholderiales bacterium]|nr:xanthine dehydrogenase family protein molybdopterin-binding subunit [Burkholderiales bacterium]